MKYMEYKVELHLRWGPKFGESSLADAYCVDEIVRYYSEVTRSVKKDVIKINFDWSQLKTLVQATLNSSSKFYLRANGGVYKLASKHEKLVVPITINSENDLSLKTYLPVIEKLITEIYIVSNLSVPGILDIYEPELIFEGESFHRLIPLHNYYFEELSNGKVSKKYPFALHVKFSQVKKWYEALRIGECSQAKSPAERAIYSLLHITTIDQRLIGVVPWIFCALESIFSTSVGMGGKQLKDQMLYLLTLKPEHKRRFKQKIDRLLELRHSFIHGSYAVPSIYPDDESEEEFALVEFGVVVVILCLQRLAEKNWSGLKIEPTITPCEIRTD